MPNPITSGMQPVKIQGRSGFDKSFKNLLSAKVGTLVPVLCDPVIPGTRVDLRSALKVAMPPLASDTFMDLRLKLEAFFVPAQACYGGFNDWVSRRDISIDTGEHKKAILPYISGNRMNVATGDSRAEFMNPGTLLDYLGFKAPTLHVADADSIYLPNYNLLPLVAYHRIYDRFYRNSLIEKPLFNRPGSLVSPTFGSPLFNVGNLPYLTFVEGQEGAASLFINEYDPTSSSVVYDVPGIRPYLGDYYLADNVYDYDKEYANGAFCLRQRNFDADYFTTATPTAQKGDPAAVKFVVDSLSGEGEISIAAIRAMNALQLFRERNNYVDDNIHSYNRAHYGVNRAGYGESLPVFLGHGSVDVYSDPVAQTSQPSGNTSQNPLASTVGADFGRVSGNGQVELISGFEAPEFGYVMVIASLVPRATYSTGVNRHFLDLVNEGIGDIPDPILQGVGPQEVFNYELAATALNNVSPTSPEGWRSVFGYQQRFAHYMEKLDECHGLFRDGESLEAFTLQRGFQYAALSHGFLQIPTSFMDQVAATRGDISDYGYWLDIFHNYRVSMPLAAYSIPSLENPDGATEWVNKPGYNLR